MELFVFCGEVVDLKVAKHVNVFVERGDVLVYWWEQDKHGPRRLQAAVFVNSMVAWFSHGRFLYQVCSRHKKLFVLFLLCARHVSSLFMIAFNSVDTSWVLSVQFANILRNHINVDSQWGMFSIRANICRRHGYIARREEDKKRKVSSAAPKETCKSW